MKIEHLCHVKFSWNELQNILAETIECESNEHIVGSSENLRLLDIANNARKGHSYVEVVDDGVTLMIDGVAYTEEMGG